MCTCEHAQNIVNCSQNFGEHDIPSYLCWMKSDLYQIWDAWQGDIKDKPTCTNCTKAVKCNLLIRSNNEKTRQWDGEDRLHPPYSWHLEDPQELILKILWRFDFIWLRFFTLISSYVVLHVYGKFQLFLLIRRESRTPHPISHTWRMLKVPDWSPFPLFLEVILEGCWRFLTGVLEDDIIHDVRNHHYMWLFSCVPNFSSLAVL